MQLPLYIAILGSSLISQEFKYSNNEGNLWPSKLIKERKIERVEIKIVNNKDTVLDRVLLFNKHGDITKKVFYSKNGIDTNQIFSYEYKGKNIVTSSFYEYSKNGAIHINTTESNFNFPIKTITNKDRNNTIRSIEVLTYNKDSLLIKKDLFEVNNGTKSQGLQNIYTYSKDLIKINGYNANKILEFIEIRQFNKDANVLNSYVIDPKEGIDFSKFFYYDKSGLLTKTIFNKGSSTSTSNFFYKNRLLSIEIISQYNKEFIYLYEYSCH
jgi:hypothetical protein